mmetsp:Transcript_25701/g.66168  ORF Transcript_25701/g.66168 Transcript_25701/m.66168 type:complete len:341 (-) Transcript_25701:682-1704(-)
MSNVRQEAASYNASCKQGLGTATKDFIAGGVAGALSIAITQPLDTVRINLQQSSTGSSAATTAALNGNSAILRKGTGSVTQEVTHLLHEGGLRALWRGLTFPLVFASLQNAILFQVCGSVLRSHSEVERLRDDKNRSIPTVSQAATAGCVAGLAQVFIWSPVELIKLRLQLQRDASPSRQVVAGGRAAWTTGPVASGSLGMLRQVMQHEGLRGLYRGFTVSMLRDVPSYGIYFATYYHVCTQIEQLKQGTNVHPENASPSTQILAGGLSGYVAGAQVSVGTWLITDQDNPIPCRLRLPCHPAGAKAGSPTLPAQGCNCQVTDLRLDEHLLLGCGEEPNAG